MTITYITQSIFVKVVNKPQQACKYGGLYRGLDRGQEGVNLGSFCVFLRSLRPANTHFFLADNFFSQNKVFSHIYNKKGII